MALRGEEEMAYRVPRFAPLVFFTAGALLLASCGGGADTTNVAEPTAASTTTTQAPQSTETTEAPAEDLPKCEGTIEQIEFGSTINSEVAGEDMYFCVEVPTGVDSFTVSLTGMTQDLELFVGYPDFETLIDGGFGLKFSTSPDTQDEEVTVDIDPDLLWSPGSYYIEVGPNSNDPSSPFTLTVSSP